MSDVQSLVDSCSAGRCHQHHPGDSDYGCPVDGCVPLDPGSVISIASDSPRHHPPYIHHCDGDLS